MVRDMLTYIACPLNNFARKSIELYACVIIECERYTTLKHEEMYFMGSTMSNNNILSLFYENMKFQGTLIKRSCNT